MQMKITRIKESEWVDTSLSDCMVSGYRSLSLVMLRTVEPVPVAQLPGADCKQYGHTVASGWERMSIRSAVRLFRKPRLEVGDTIDIEPVGFFRNREMRKAGTFRVYVKR
jgi:hypothetical protein